MSELRDLDYDDSYRTCAETFSTLRVFSDSLAPEEITKALQIEPTRSFRKGDSHSQGKLQRKANGWFYSTHVTGRIKTSHLWADQNRPV
jgi:hypothetical protein